MRFTYAKHTYDTPARVSCDTSCVTYRVTYGVTYYDMTRRVYAQSPG